MNFAYVAYDKSGAVKSGSLEAGDARQAREQLRQRGLYATELRGGEARGAAPSETARAPCGGGGHQRELTAFARQLEVLVSSGTPLVEALAAIERQTTEPKWRGIVGDVRTQVEEGRPLSEAMGAHPRSFNAICRSLVAAGEASGRLGEMLNRLATLVRQQQHVRKSVIGTLVYPALLIGVSLAVLAMMIVFVLPRFSGMFETLNADLPLATEALMALSGVIRGYWWAMLVVLAGLVVGGVAWAMSERGRRVVDGLLVRAPMLGPMVRSFMTARLARILGVLLESHLPMLEAIDLARRAAGNQEYKALLDRVEAQVTRGEAMSSVFAASPLIAGSVSEAVRNAERSGTVGPVLTSIAEYLDEDNEVLIRSLTSILEPVILMVIGVIVATVAISMFLPMFDLVASAPGAAP